MLRIIVPLPRKPESSGMAAGCQCGAPAPPNLHASRMLRHSSTWLNIVLMDLDVSLAALADPTRRAILERLAGGETRVTDLARPFDLSLNAVSKHIRVLERAGLVRRRRSGREHVLSLDLSPLHPVAAWI